MATRTTLSADEADCLCVKSHSPLPQELEVHHILPLAWDGPDTKANRLPLCPTTHSNVHRLLRAYVKAKGMPSWAIRSRYSVYARALAQRAWDERPKGVALPDPHLH